MSDAQGRYETGALEQATKRRLARLSTRPVDTTRLERHLNAVIEHALVDEAHPDGAHRVAPSTMGRTSIRNWWRPLTTAAAAILMVATIGWLSMNISVSPAMANPSQLAQIHYEVANGLAPRFKVDSVAEANRVLAAQQTGAIAFPELPGTIHACCLQAYAGTTLTCALIERGDQRITVAIADRATMHSPMGRRIVRDGRQFMVHQSDGITMVMANRGDRWMCVMGEIDANTLVEVALDITF